MDGMGFIGGNQFLGWEFSHSHNAIAPFFSQCKLIILGRTKLDVTIFYFRGFYISRVIELPGFGGESKLMLKFCPKAPWNGNIYPTALWGSSMLTTEDQSEMHAAADSAGVEFSGDIIQPLMLITTASGSMSSVVAFLDILMHIAAIHAGRLDTTPLPARTCSRSDCKLSQAIPNSEAPDVSHKTASKLTQTRWLPT